MITTETNHYAQSLLQQANLRPRSRLHKWSPTTDDEMKVFIGLLLLMALNKKPEIHMYWMKEPLLSSPIFPAVMLRDRFQILLRCWHFCDNSAADPAADKLYKIRSLLDSLSSSFQSVYVPDVNLSVDEELVLWKGRLQFKQYIPLKRSRFGIKIYCLCEDSGYTYRMQVYTGKDNPDQEIYTVLPDDTEHLSKTEKIVVHLLMPLLDKGYQLYCDNFYTSVQLFSYLDSHYTGCCGTMRRNRVPKIVQDAGVGKGESVGYRNENLLCVKFKDKRDVYVLSNLHSESTTRKRVRGRHENYIDRPDCIADYNKHMGGVDMTDQMIAPYDATRKTLKWYRKLVVHFLQVAMLNAYLLFQKANPTSKLRFVKFQLQVIRAMIASTSVDAEAARDECVARLSGRHFLTHTPPTASKGARKNLITRRCRVCYKKGIRREVTYICGRCPSQAALCPVPCHELYHTKLKYWE